MSKESKQPYKESSQADVQPSEAIVFKSQLKPEGGSFNSLHIPDEILTEFMDNFPLAFDIVSRGLKAGGTLEKTFKTVSTEIQGPVAKDLW